MLAIPRWFIPTFPEGLNSICWLTTKAAMHHTEKATMVITYLVGLFTIVITYLIGVSSAAGKKGAMVTTPAADRRLLFLLVRGLVVVGPRDVVIPTNLRGLVGPRDHGLPPAIRGSPG